MPKTQTVTPADREPVLSSLHDGETFGSSTASNQSDTNANRRTPWILSAAGSEGPMESMADSELREMLASTPSIMTNRATSDNNLNEPLLTDVEQDFNRNTVESSITSDEERPSIGTEYCCYRPSNCCRSFLRDKWFIGICTFAILTWAGFMFSIWSTWSCNLIHINWNPSETFSVTGIGFWRYQDTTKKVTANGMVKEVKCNDYGSYVHHSEISNAGRFFPVNKENRAFSVVSLTLAGIVFLGLMAFMILASVQPDLFMNRASNPHYPWKALSACYILAGGLLVAVGTIELHAVVDLMNLLDPVNDKRESPVCNAAYSTCQLGSGGILAVTGACCDFVAAAIAFVAAFVTLNEKCKTGDASAR